MKDLTKIKTPFVLLGKKTRKALRASTDQIQVYHDNGWHDIDRPAFLPFCTYRAKPADPIAVLSEMQEAVFKSVLGYADISERASSIAAAPAIFAAVKEWQEAVRDGRIATNGTCDLIGAKAHAALMAIVVPS